jgi:hypothetical protein
VGVVMGGISSASLQNSAAHNNVERLGRNARLRRHGGATRSDSRL